MSSLRKVGLSGLGLKGMGGSSGLRALGFSVFRDIMRGWRRYEDLSWLPKRQKSGTRRSYGGGGFRVWGF